MRLPERASRLLLPVGSLLAVAFAVGGGPLQHWIAAAIALALLPSLLRELPEEVGEQVRRTAPLGLLFILTFLTLGDLALGRMPASRDHGIHYFQTSILVNELLPTGRLTGWSERLNNGYAFGDSYPVLGYLWVAAGHLLTGGLMSLRASYAFGLLGVWLLGLWGVYRVSGIVWREVTGDEAPRAHRWAATLGATAWLLDAGGSREGGWDYTMYHGVWPQLLSTALWVAGLVWTWRALRGPSPRRWAVAALCHGGAILAHPFGLLAVGGTAMLWPPLLLTNGALRDLPPGAIRTWAIIHGVALGLSAAWVVPFLASADAMGRSPVPWAPLGELASQLIRGTFLQGDYLGFVAPLGLVGGLIVLLRAATVGRLVVLLMLGMLIAGSEESITLLQLDLLVPAFKNLQFPRYTIVLKPLWFALAGVGAAMLGSALAAILRETVARPMGEHVVVAVVAGPLVAATIGGLGRLMPRPVGTIDTLEESSVQHLEPALRAALEAEQAALGEVPMRVAFLRVGMSGTTYPLIPLADVGASVVLDGHIPSINTEHRVRRRSAAVLSGLGVTHVIHDRPLRDKDHSVADSLEEIEHFGALRLARFVPEAEPLDPVGLDRGRAEVTVEEDTPEHKVMQVSALSAGVQGARLRILQAPYWRWNATLEGEALELAEGPLFGGALTGTRIELPGEGRLELTYTRTDRERRALWLSLGLLVLCAGGLIRGRPLELAERLQPPGVRRMGWGVAGLVAVSLLVSAHRRQARTLETTWAEVPETEGGHATTFVRDLVSSGDYTTWWTPEDLCEAILGKNSRPGCSAVEMAPRVSMMYREPYLYRCVRITIPPRGLARVLFHPRPGEEVVGFIRRVEHRGSGKNIKWRLTTDEPVKKLGNLRQPFVVPADTTDEITVRFSTTSKRPEQICVAAAAFAAE